MHKRSDGMRFPFLRRFPRQAISLHILNVLAFSAAVALPSGAARADGVDVRRLGAEIAVMAADARRLVGPALPSDLHARGLMQRLRGGLAVLPLSVRAARESDPSLPALDETRLAQIRAALFDGDAVSAANGLAGLTSVYRFDPSGLLPADDRLTALTAAKALHDAYCAGCHDSPELSVARPAWNLFTVGQAIPAVELAARLVVGLRGDSRTGLANPLRDSEISALIALYQTGQDPAK